MQRSTESRVSPLGYSALLLGTLIVLLPIGALLMSWAHSQPEVWSHLWQTQLPRLIGNTLSLLVGVGVGVTFIGVLSAWCVTHYEFPGRRWIEWALMLPLAIPPYVMAFVFLGIWDFSGPIQQSIKAIYPEFQYINMRGTVGVSIVLSLVLYPYVYLTSRAAFYRLGNSQLEAARLLGMNSWRTFLHVGLPMAKPGVLVGLSLVMMETLADFGAVAVFNFDTFTTAIYKAWYGFFNLEAAAQLASLLLIMVALVAWLEIQARKHPVTCGRTERRERRHLNLCRGWCLTLFLCSLLIIAFGLPLIRLIIWSIDYPSELDMRFLGFILNSLALGSIAGGCLVITGFLLAWYRHQHPHRTVTLFGRMMTAGYALPGSVLAVGIMLILIGTDQVVIAPIMESLGWEPWVLAGSLFGLILAYWIRFFSVAHNPLHAAFYSLTPSLPEAARSLGVPEKGLIWRLYLPLFSPTCLMAFIMVAIDVMKEMPATLLLRPFGWETLAVKVYELTAEGEWERAAMPALLLVALSLIPVIYLTRRSDFKSR